MSRNAPTTIQCPGCGNHRTVTPRQHRRAKTSGGILCTICRGGTETRQHTDTDLRYWLTAYGANPPARKSVRQFIAAGGTPPELKELAQSIFPTRYS